jgi:hypothetical protein
VRAGIRQSNADFRGFLFVDEEPTLRIFGNFHSDRSEYNVTYFDLHTAGEPYAVRDEPDGFPKPERLRPSWE